MIIGRVGERIASRFMENKGYSVLDRNYRQKWGEIDLIVSDDKGICFIEVKSAMRNASQNLRESGFRPEENVHEYKIRRLNRAIQTYFTEKDIPTDVYWQLDLLVVVIDLETKRATVERIENIS